MRLRSFATTIKPHTTEDTVTLNQVRRGVLLLDEPMQVLMGQLQENVDAAKKKEAKLIDLKRNKEDLEDNLYLDSYKLVPFELEQPMTVCTNPSCISEEPVSADKTEAQTVYKTRCHVGCRNTFCSANKTNSRGLKHCSAMTYSENLKWLRRWLIPASYIPINGTCKHCLAENNQTCYWYEHKHVKVDYKKVLVRTALCGTKDQIDSIQELEMRAEIALCNLQRVLKEYNEENDILTKASALFASYIVHNSIASINYQALNVLKLQIKNQTVKYGASDDRVGPFKIEQG